MNITIWKRTHKLHNPSNYIYHYALAIMKSKQMGIKEAGSVSFGFYKRTTIVNKNEYSSSIGMIMIILNKLIYLYGGHDTEGNGPTFYSSLYQ